MQTAIVLSFAVIVFASMDADAGSPFERGVRVASGPTLAKDAPSAATPAAPVPSAAEQATSIARSVVEKVDPTSKSLLKRPETDPNRKGSLSITPPGQQDSAASPPPANSATAGAATPVGATNKQEKKLGPGVTGSKGEDAAKEVQQVQRGLINEQKANVGTVQ